MKLKLNDIRNLSRGTVIRDDKFMFPDGEIKAKYFIILSDLIKDSYIYTLTTSKLDTYQTSIHAECIIEDPIIPLKSIVEIRRVSLTSAKKLAYKINDLDNVGVLLKENFDYILDMKPICF